MNTKKIIIIFLVFSNSILCADYIKIADKITGQFSKDISKTKNLYLTGYGGAMMDNIQGITLKFTSSSTISITEARKLYLEILEKYLYEVNSNREIRPYLDNYPFTLNNIELSLSFDKESTVVYMLKGKNNRLVYCGKDTKDEFLPTIHKEEYHEALKIFQEEQCKSYQLKQS